MQFDQLRRRELIALLGGAAAAWPLGARAQQPEHMRRLGILMPYSVDDVLGLELASALRDGLLDRGWAERRNIEINYRWIGKDIDRRSVHAAELVAASPNVLFACYLAQLAPLALETRTIPIVFVGVSDPVGSGYVGSFARPGGNITGFTLYEASMAGKWLEVLKTLAPAVTRVAFMINPETAVLRGTFYLRAFETAAAALALEPVTSNVHNAGDVEAVIAALGQRPGGGLIVAPEAFSELHREFIVTLVARHRVPTIYGTRQFALSGGLVSYGPNRPCDHALGGCGRESVADHFDIISGAKPCASTIASVQRRAMPCSLGARRRSASRLPPVGMCSPLHLSPK